MYVKHGAFYCKSLASALEYMGKQMPFFKSESENWKSTPIKFLDFVHSVEILIWKCLTELAEFYLVCNKHRASKKVGKKSLANGYEVNKAC